MLHVTFVPQKRIVLRYVWYEYCRVKCMVLHGVTDLHACMYLRRSQYHAMNSGTPVWLVLQPPLYRVGRYVRNQLTARFARLLAGIKQPAGACS